MVCSQISTEMNECHAYYYDINIYTLVFYKIHQNLLIYLVFANFIGRDGMNFKPLDNRIYSSSDKCRVERFMTCFFASSSLNFNLLLFLVALLWSLRLFLLYFLYLFKRLPIFCDNRKSRLTCKLKFILANSKPVTWG